MVSEQLLVIVLDLTRHFEMKINSLLLLFILFIALLHFVEPLAITLITSSFGQCERDCCKGIQSELNIDCPHVIEFVDSEGKFAIQGS